MHCDAIHLLTCSSDMFANKSFNSIVCVFQIYPFNFCSVDPLIENLGFVKKKFQVQQILNFQNKHRILNILSKKRFQ